MRMQRPACVRACVCEREMQVMSAGLRNEQVERLSERWCAYLMSQADVKLSPTRVRGRVNLRVSDTGLKQERQQPETEQVMAQRRQTSPTKESFPSGGAGASSLGLSFLLGCCGWPHPQTSTFTAQHHSQGPRQAPTLEIFYFLTFT